MRKWLDKHFIQTYIYFSIVFYLEIGKFEYSWCAWVIFYYLLLFSFIVFRLTLIIFLILIVVRISAYFAIIYLNFYRVYATTCFPPAVCLNCLIVRSVWISFNNLIIFTSFFFLYFVCCLCNFVNVRCRLNLISFYMRENRLRIMSDSHSMRDFGQHDIIGKQSFITHTTLDAPKYICAVS